MTQLSKSDLAVLKQVRAILDMERANFSQGVGSTAPITLTEGSVSNFIRDRTRIWRESWLIGPLDKLIAKHERNES